MEGFRLPLTRRGVRTTLLNGVLMCIEVETSPRHHKQRRAVSVYIQDLREVKSPHRLKIPVTEDRGVDQ